MSDGPDYIDETHQRIVEFASEFLDDDDERESFVDGLLERRGYVRESRWAPPPPPPGGGGKGGLLKPPAAPKGGGKQPPARGGGYFGGR